MSFVIEKTKLSRSGFDFIDEPHLHGLLGSAGRRRRGARRDRQEPGQAAAGGRGDGRPAGGRRAGAASKQIFDAARQLKRDVYGNRIVLFAPLYVGNECTNDCLYCAFRRSNRAGDPPHARRGRAPPAGRGPGEQGPQAADPGLRRAPAATTPEFMAECVQQVYAIKTGHGEIRRVNINAAPLDHAGYRDRQGGRHRHLPDLPGNLPPRHLSPASIRRTRARATTSGGWTAWPGRWRPTATTWASAPCSACTTGGSRCWGW